MQERKQRTEHDGESAVDHRGDLEAETLPAASALEDENVALRQRRRHNVALVVAEGGVAVDVAQGEV